MWLTDTCVKLLKTAGADKKPFLKKLIACRPPSPSTSQDHN